MFIFRLKRTLFALIYLTTIAYITWFWFAPAIAFHGGWTVFTTIFLSMALCSLTTYAFLSTTKPQATFVTSTTNRQQMIGKLLLLRAQAQSNNQPDLTTIYDNKITDLKETMQ